MQKTTVPAEAQKALDLIGYHLKLLRDGIDTRQLVKDYSLNTWYENFFLGVFNAVYGLQLINLNQENPNAKYVDLIDRTNKIAYQITSERSPDKIRDTFAALKEPEYQGYTIKIYYLLEKANPQKATIEELNAEFGIQLADCLLDAGDLLKEIYHLQPQKKIIEVAALFQGDPPSPAPNKNDYDPQNSAFLVPFRAKGDFMVGREQALSRVRAQLLAGKPTSIGQTALFQGIGGLGKTQLAVEYAHQYQADYPNGVYWLTADEDIDAQLTELAVRARWIAPESEHAIKLAVAKHRIKSYSNCLIVFDNLESADAIQAYLPDASASPHILVTSRREQPDFVDVSLDLLDAAQSSVMLVKEAGRAPSTDAETAAAQDIAKLLGGLPLALELAGAYLKRRGAAWCDYRDTLQTDLKQALPTRLASLTKHEADLFNTLRISEHDIADEPLLKPVLDVLTWSGSSPMGVPLLAYLLDVPAIQLQSALGLGVALRLLQKVPDSDRYAVHRLVQEVRRQEQPLAADRASVLAQRVGDWFEAKRKDFADLAVFELEFEHLRTWQRHAQQHAPVESVRLLWLQAYPADHRGQYEAARQIVQQAYTAHQTQQLPRASLLANLQNDLANCHSALGATADALPLADQALSLRRELFGEKHPDIATSLGNLASYHNELGKPRRALELATEALAMRRELFGDKHLDIAISLNNLVLYHDGLGNPRRALELATEALAMRRELFGEKHPDIATSLHNLAFVYEKLDQHAAALKSGQAALAMCRELLGEAHPNTLESLRFVAGKLYANPFAAKQVKELIADYLKQLPKDHPARAEVLSIQNARSGFRAQGKSPKRKQK